MDWCLDAFVTVRESDVALTRMRAKVLSKLKGEASLEGVRSHMISCVVKRCVGWRHIRARRHGCVVGLRWFVKLCVGWSYNYGNKGTSS